MASGGGMLEEWLGPGIAGRLMDRFGGTQVKVPKFQRGKVWDELCACLGEADARRVVSTFGGEYLYVPMNIDRIRDELRQRIIEEAEAGKTIDEIASTVTYEVRVSSKYVSRVLQDARARIAQQHLRRLALPRD